MNILLTCAGRRNYLVEYFKNALAGIGGKVYAANSTSHSTALIAADRGFILPSLHDPGYIDSLIQVCHAHDIAAIIPLFDLELPVLAGARGRLQALGIRAIVASSHTVDICNDKWRSLEYLKMQGFPVLSTFWGCDDAMAAIESHELAFPLIIKPRWGMGSIALFEAEDKTELEVFFKKAKRLIRRSYLARASQQDPERDILIQEKLMGDEYGLDVINDLDGNYITTFVKKKISMRSGETDGAVTVDHPPLMQLGQKLGENLQHLAVLDVDVLIGQDGSHVLELNARFGGGYPFSHLAGADIPAAIVAWLRNEAPDPAWFTIAPNVTAYKGLTPMKENQSVQF